VRALSVVDQSQIAEARRGAAEAAAAIAFNETDVGRVALVASELCTNLIKHGGGGELLIGSYDDPTGSGIELIAVDKGPGIADLQASQRDGHSTAGTAGHGLGAIRRQSQAMQLVSWPELGTVVMARLAANNPKINGHTITNAPWGSVSIALQGQEVCGDACAVFDTAVGRTLLVADGIGHGSEAAIAATEAVRLFQQHQARPVPEILEYLHAGLRPTRGAAVAVARFDEANRKVVYGGIGNISGIIVSPMGTRRMISLNGTAGHVARKVQAFDYPYHGGVVVMCSDGVATNWSLDRYPGLVQAHPSLIAAVLYRDFGRRRDDVTVAVATDAVSGQAASA
jgi:anti-sigma regulatory factor (Ser/Thr protein kinase)